MYLSGRFVCLDDVAAVREYDVVVFVEGLLQSEKGVGRLRGRSRAPSMGSPSADIPGRLVIGMPPGYRGFLPVRLRAPPRETLFGTGRTWGRSPSAWGRKPEALASCRAQPAGLGSCRPVRGSWRHRREGSSLWRLSTRSKHASANGRLRPESYTTGAPYVLSSCDATVDVSRPSLSCDREPVVSFEQLRKPLAPDGAHVEDGSRACQKDLRLVHVAPRRSRAEAGQLDVQGPAGDIACPLDVGP